MILKPFSPLCDHGSSNHNISWQEIPSPAEIIYLADDEIQPTEIVVTAEKHFIEIANTDISDHVKSTTTEDYIDIADLFNHGLIDGYVDLGPASLPDADVTEPSDSVLTKPLDSDIAESSVPRSFSDTPSTQDDQPLLISLRCFIGVRIDQVLK